MKTRKNDIKMKKIFKILPVILLVACGGPKIDGELADLSAKRDSLQNVQTDIEKQLNKIDVKIAAVDSSVNPNDLKIIKKISMQKNKIAGIEKKIKKLENTMTAREVKKLVPVAVKEMLGEQFDHYIITYGEVEAKNYARISPEMGGRIEKIYVERGQQVEKGHLLVSLNADAVDKQIKGVKSSLEFATKTFDKQNNLWEQNIGSEIEYLTAKNAKESLESQLEALQAQKRMAQISAPFAGVVDKIYPKEGEMAGPSFPVIELVNLSKLIIKADVSETHIDKIKKGQTVELSFSSLPDLNRKAPILRVSKIIESVSRTFEIEMHIDNPGERIKPNMVSTIKINDFVSENAFILPSLVIRNDVTGDYVYVVKKGENKENLVNKKYVSTGLSYDENTMVTDGLTKGDLVIVKGYHLVSAGVPVNLVK